MVVHDAEIMKRLYIERGKASMRGLMIEERGWGCLGLRLSPQDLSVLCLKPSQDELSHVLHWNDVACIIEKL